MEEFGPFTSYLLIPVVLIGVVVLLLFIFTVLRGLNYFVVVQEGCGVVVQRLGRFNRVLQPGVHIVVPLLESVRTVVWSREEEDRTGRKGLTKRVIYSLSTIPTNEQAHDLPAFNSVTMDRISVSVNGIMFFRITDIRKAVYGVNDLYKAIENLVETAIRDFASKTRFENMFTERDRMMSAVVSQLATCEEDWGIKVTKFDVQDIQCSEQLMKATETAAKMQREAQAQLELAQAKRATEMEEIALRTESNIARKKAELELEKMEKAAQHELSTMQLKHESERREIQREMELAEAEAQLLIQAKKTKEEQIAQTNRYNQRQEYLASLNSITGLPKEAIMAEIQSEAWREIAANPNTKVVLPYDTLKLLGTSQLMSTINSIQD